MTKTTPTTKKNIKVKNYDKDKPETVVINGKKFSVNYFSRMSKRKLYVCICILNCFGTPKALGIGKALSKADIRPLHKLASAAAPSFSSYLKVWNEPPETEGHWRNEDLWEEGSRGIYE